MSTQTVHRAAAGTASQSLSELAGIVSRAFDAIGAGVRASAEWNRLNAMSDAELARRGLGREDIARAVFERHFR